MGIRQIIALFLAVFVTLSCGRFVKKEVLDASKTENEELKETLKQVQESYVRQNKELNTILAELTEISRKTSSLQLKVEQGTVIQSQAEMISSNIQSIKGKIDRLEAEAQAARKINKDYALAVSTIKSLRATIANHEAEISRLKETVSHQEKTIQSQKDTIVSQQMDLERQNQQLSRQRDELDATLRRQVNLLFQAAGALEDIADDGDFSITGKRNKNSVREYRKMIYEKALSFYQDAAAQGHKEAAARINAVKAKVEAL